MRITNFRRLAFWLLLAAFLSSAKLHDNAGGLVLSPAADNAPGGATPASQDGSAASTTYRGGPIQSVFEGGIGVYYRCPEKSE